MMSLFVCGSPPPLPSPAALSRASQVERDLYLHGLACIRLSIHISLSMSVHTLSSSPCRGVAASSFVEVSSKTRVSGVCSLPPPPLVEPVSASVRVRTDCSTSVEPSKLAELRACLSERGGEQTLIYRKQGQENPRSLSGAAEDTRCKYAYGETDRLFWGRLCS